ncbi:DUF1797 family protein [Weissella diestrammenae]|uniref:DUF1797 family protein n=1 Tax=Weissella diestrammenae TaxID=1162633 RepID=A0A7G9T427_9LACO|nr:DUF1797 family protein [Weissella diestrammenae]MCM0583052.1 DUF1797 family protein [Weissella diestrammenae]QNN74852.1 DUF1797 family protein [Weissella diestrammenae]
MSRESELVKIIKRLESMTLDQNSEFQERHFDMFGVNVLTVLYDQPSHTFAVYGGRDDSRRFAFDNLDALAIDIYETLADFKAVF